MKKKKKLFCAVALKCSHVCSTIQILVYNRDTFKKSYNKLIFVQYHIVVNHPTVCALTLGQNNPISWMDFYPWGLGADFIQWESFQGKLNYKTLVDCFVWNWTISKKEKKKNHSVSTLNHAGCGVFTWAFAVRPSVPIFEFFFYYWNWCLLFLCAVH